MLKGRFEGGQQPSEALNPRIPLSIYILFVSCKEQILWTLVVSSCWSDSVFTLDTAMEEKIAAFLLDHKPRS